MPRPLRVDFYYPCTTRNPGYWLQNYLWCIIKVCFFYGYDINTTLFNNSDNVRQFRHRLYTLIYRHLRTTIFAFVLTDIEIIALRKSAIYLDVITVKSLVNTLIMAYYLETMLLLVTMRPTFKTCHFHFMTTRIRHMIGLITITKMSPRRYLFCTNRCISVLSSGLMVPGRPQMDFK